MGTYPEYKHTLIDWLGPIPSPWSLRRVGQLFSERKQKVDDKTFPPLSVTMGGVVDQLSDIAKTDHTDNRKLVRKGDFVINSRSDRKGSSGISPRDGSVSVINIVMETREFETSFYEYLFKSFYFKEEFFRNGKGIHWDLWSTKWDQLKVILIPVPDPNTQSLISKYLGKKTSQIDSLIEKIEQKIELLKEQRTSLINQCVTKGLNPNVEMKDSGVEWIGDIPIHWKVSFLKYVSSHTNKKRLPEQGEKKISPKNVESGTGKIMNYYSDYGTNGVEFQLGDTLLNKLRVYLSKVVFCNFSGLSMGEMIVLRPTKYNPKYQFHLLSSSLFIDSLNSLSEGVKVPRPPVEGIMRTAVPVPPENEQILISKYLDKKTSQIGSLIAKETKRIELLKEYRQSLISNFVTGKLRVMENMI